MKQATVTISMDMYAIDFLERVFLLLVTVEEADAVLIPNEVADAAAKLRDFLDNHGRRLIA